MRTNRSPWLALLLTASLTACDPGSDPAPAAANASDQDPPAPASAKPAAIPKAGDDVAPAASAPAADAADVAPAAAEPAVPSVPLDKEAARAAAKNVAGVRSVVWMDDSNLFAIVESGEFRTVATIEGICRELAALGDTRAVAVTLQDGAARTGDELQNLGRACLADGGPTPRALDVIDPATRAEHRANQDLQLTDEERRNREESERVLADDTDTVYD